MYGKIVFEYDAARVKHDCYQTLEFDIKMTVSFEQELPEHEISHCNGWKAATHGLRFFIISNMLNIVKDARDPDKQNLLNSSKKSPYYPDGFVDSDTQKHGIEAYVFPPNSIKEASREIVFFEVDDVFEANEFILNGIKADDDPRSVLIFNDALEKMKSVWNLSPTEDAQEYSENTHLYVQFTILETVRTCPVPSMDDTLDCCDKELTITVVLSRVDESTESKKHSSDNVIEALMMSLDRFADNYDLIQLSKCDSRSITSTIQSSTRARSNVLRIDLSEGRTLPTLPIVMDCTVIVNTATLSEEKNSFSSKIKESVKSHLLYKTITLQNTEVKSSSSERPNALDDFFAFVYKPTSDFIPEAKRNQARPSSSSSSSQADAPLVVEGDYVYLTMKIERVVTPELADEHALVTKARATLVSGSTTIPMPGVMYEYAFSVKKVGDQSSKSTIALCQAQENLLENFADNFVYSAGSIESISGESQKFQLPCDTTFDSLEYTTISITCKPPPSPKDGDIHTLVIVAYFNDIIAEYSRGTQQKDFFKFKTK